MFERCILEGPEVVGLEDALLNYWAACASSGLDDMEIASALMSFTSAWVVGYTSRGDSDKINEALPVVTAAARAGGENACELAFKLLASRRPCG